MRSRSLTVASRRRPRSSIRGGTGRCTRRRNSKTWPVAPYRHFLQRILKIEPVDEVEYDQDKWLEDRVYGSLLHDVLESAMTELCEAGRKPSMDFLPRMKEIADEALEAWRNLVPSPSDAAFEKRRTDLFEACAVFLRTEEEACRTVTPKYFELPFGIDDDAPFTLPLGGGTSIKLRGRIDRVDHDETANEWHGWDSKSGRPKQVDAGGVLVCGTKIQHAIYARAVEKLVGGRVTR